MKTIWKFALTRGRRDDLMEAEIPIGAIYRHLAVLEDTLCLWVEVDSTVAAQTRYFRAYRTGDELSVPPRVSMTYVGSISFMLREDEVSWRTASHIYELSAPGGSRPV